MQPSTSPTIERLAAYLFDGPRPDAALADMPDWLAATPRFRSFAEANRDKIRKKLRHATDGPARLDLRAVSIDGAAGAGILPRIVMHGVVR